MSKKPSNHQLVGRVAYLSIEWYRAQTIAKACRAQLNDEYFRYFQVNGEPEPNRRGIRVDDPRYEGVINFTNAAYERLVAAQRQKNNAKRRLETAIRALMAFSGDTVQVPKKPYVARANIHGETLQ
ncbi:hypothetical protein [Pseudomonas chlororaphis]|uniref:Uncharacterized protein n=1 Tax=Pseudomonas chlororaphis O6 TaxID=1037915 RepID=A0AB33WTB9_9PSED|nr:hypothetical protein [Pseudomonas chlororaphis]EIM16252.1 hypothetical protein PchlO6_1221 [Pseudomonas chlororaphis O6]